MLRLGRFFPTAQARIPGRAAANGSDRPSHAPQLRHLLVRETARVYVIDREPRFGRGDAPQLAGVRTAHGYADDDPVPSAIMSSIS